MVFSRFHVRRWLFVILLVLCGSSLHSVEAQWIAPAQGGTLKTKGAELTLDLIASNTARVHVVTGGVSSPRTLAVDPALTVQAVGGLSQSRRGDRIVVAAPGIRVEVDPSGASVRLCAVAGGCITAEDLVGTETASELHLRADRVETLYGMRGLKLEDDGTGITRAKGATVQAGVQGDGAAPMFFTPHFGVLVDSDGGAFEVSGTSIRFKQGSRKDLEFFVVFGPPMETMSAMMRISGLPPMAPKWTLGFINSLWGTNEADLYKIADTYREKKIPIDAFILDFDWKAWGEDDYGEWRWNSTSGVGSVNPDLFPDGASGKFAAEMAGKGIKLAGILKPRILLTPAGAPTSKTKAAAYADAHHLLCAREKPEEDYVTHRESGILNFSLPETRVWFWEHLQPSFSAGLVGWWNDEADGNCTPELNNSQFVNMARTLYDGQRKDSNLRAWSLNRNYYLGGDRYGYGLWSGDIQTGFASMAYQERRMIASLDLGASHWSMDTGGFKGNPTPENYARWMEFAAWVPIDRVHGDFGEKRQPWIFGSIAEAAATQAVRTRYSLMPYMYAYEHEDHVNGVGVVRPMFWVFPDDAETATLDTQWMFGDALLVSPVMREGATSQHVYLPGGGWYDFHTGKHMDGGRWVDVPVDATTWSDTPVFVREGSIVATQPPEQYVGEHAAGEETLDVFPSAKEAVFTAYDDDGVSYDYEKGAYFSQRITARRSDGQVTVKFAEAEGKRPASTHDYVVRVHARAHSVRIDGRAVRRDDSTAGTTTWAAGTDRYGDVTTLHVPAGHRTELILK